MSEPGKNPFDALLDAFRAVVREEIKAFSAVNVRTEKLLLNIEGSLRALEREGNMVSSSGARGESRDRQAWALHPIQTHRPGSVHRANEKSGRMKRIRIDTSRPVHKPVCQFSKSDDWLADLKSITSNIAAAGEC
jgi:hypothetical protein